MMSYSWLSEDKELLKYYKQVPCFYFDPKPPEKARYFAFHFPKYSEKEQIQVQKEYIESIFDLWDFGEYISDIDWKNNKVLFDIHIVPGHKIFAICSAIRVPEESPTSLLEIWSSLNNKESFDLSSFEKFLYMHYFSSHFINTNHTIYPTLSGGEVEKFISHKLKYFGSGQYGQGRNAVSKNFNEPFIKKQQFRRDVSLFQSYCPKEYASDLSRDKIPEDNFRKYLEKRTKQPRVVEGLFGRFISIPNTRILIR